MNRPARTLAIALGLALLPTAVAPGARLPARVGRAAAAPPPAGAAPLTPQLGLGGLLGALGVGNESEYREVLLVSGRPQLVIGTRAVTRVAARDGSVTVRTSVRAQSPVDAPAAGTTAKLTRTVGLVFRPAPAGEGPPGQSVFLVEVDRYSEAIAVGSDQFRLEAYSLHGSVLLDRRPAVTYAVGNWRERRSYSINRGAGRVTVSTEGELTGYDSAWSKAENAAARLWIESSRASAAGEPQRWAGSARLDLSAAWRQSVWFATADPAPMPFEGGIAVSEREEGRLRLRYDLPAFLPTGAASGTERREGEEEHALDTVPALRRLPVARLRDVGGHWAEGAILEVQALGGFDAEGSFFGPDLPMLRGDFARLAATVAGLAPAAAPARAVGAAPARAAAAPAPFADVAATDPNRPYIEAVQREGLMDGVGGDIFDPDAEVTRAQAVTVLVRATGLHARAPAPGYQTEFADDARIPLWAKDAVQAATRHGLAQGDGGRFGPDDPLTRAQAAALAQRFIRFLRDDLVRAYRDRSLDLR